MPDDFSPPPPPHSAQTGSSAEPSSGRVPAAGQPWQGMPPGYPPSGYVPSGSPFPGSSYAGVPPGSYPLFGYPPAAVQRPRRSAWFWAATTASALALTAVVFCVFFVSLARIVSNSSETSAATAASIAVVDVRGVITDADKIEKPLRKFSEDANVKGIILHIDSPGGDAAVSQEIYQEVLRVKAASHKPIVASVESVGASGAYYIAAACDRIYANRASVVGSIGVIMEWTNYGDLMRWAKLKPVVISHGELKDAGDPTRDVTPKEQAYFQSLVDNMYTQFVHDVATGRHSSEARIAPLATGQVWTGEQSLSLGLIDTLGGFRTALLDTAAKAGIQGEPPVVRSEKERHGLFAILNGDQGEDLFANPSRLLNRAPGFYFLWR